MTVKTAADTIRVAMWAPTCAPLEGVAVEPPSLQEMERGWRFAHMLMTTTQIETREGLAFARALGELLVARGFIPREELQQALDRVRRELEEKPVPRVMMARGGDKYAAENNVLIDCLERLPLCRARCCVYGFCLTEQDLDEGVARWDYGQPYWIRKRSDGYCVHCDPQTYQCQIFPHRPYVCRVYDCREDKRIWLDFEQRIPAPPGSDGLTLEAGRMVPG
jgi:Fe-S-cluster containining protein